MDKDDEQTNERIARACGVDFGEKPEHEWLRGDDGEIDHFAFENGYHNGLMCARCYHSHCEHCHAEDAAAGPCNVKAPDYLTDPARLPEMWALCEAKGWEWFLDSAVGRIEIHAERWYTRHRNDANGNPVTAFARALAAALQAEEEP